MVQTADINLKNGEFQVKKMVDAPVSKWSKFQLEIYLRRQLEKL